MSKNLVVVESPAKANTIKKYLGKDYHVVASYGHVRDLVPKEGAVNPKQNFAMTYQVLERSIKHIANLEKALKLSDNLLLATDPDREGEAISWHLCELLKSRRKLKNKKVARIVFHEITKAAIQAAILHPRDIAMDLVDAQQARRALDYLVGFNLSPLLWRKVRPGLSAGRVQSPALRMIVEREQHIQAFKSQEYWSIVANLQSQQKKFVAKLVYYHHKKLQQFTITTAQKAKTIKEDLLNQSGDELVVTSVERKQRKRQPAPPFITSTMQQEAARKLGFTAKRSMKVAQQLYESGLITYMRTDSTHLSHEAVNNIRQLIVKRYGNDNLPSQARVYKTKAKNAQEAHEAIRPTAIDRFANALSLDNDQKKLYNLIWQRTLACQMRAAIIDMVAINFDCAVGNVFRATGSTVAKPGFMLVYLESRDDKDSHHERDNNNLLPPLKKGDRVTLLDILCQQHFTEPPPRYTEASLIKTLEEYGIGRPSTYAVIISTLQTRQYVTIENKRFHPTDVGEVVNHFLTHYFMTYVNYDFTAHLEDKLDAVSRGEQKWIPLLEQFWQPFQKQVHDTMENVKRSDVVAQKIDECCPKCGKQLMQRLGRGGRFIGCSAYPDCKYTRNVGGEDASTQPTGRQCLKCGKDLIVKHGRYGQFLACCGYPDCRYVEPLQKPKDTNVTCPKCRKGTMLEKTSRRNKIFYACSKYPNCQYAVWHQPLNQTCPKCHWPMLIKRSTKKQGERTLCPQANCHYNNKLD